jgi:glucokinase
MLSCIDSLADRSSGTEIIGIGIGVSGMIDFPSGTCLFATGLPDFENVPVRESVEKRFSVPVIVDDSSRTHAVGERYHGLGRGVPNFIHVVLGEGIGAGVFINGTLYRGKSGISGEIGHIVIDRNGPRCRCGNHGCLEKYASGSAIAGQIQEALAEGVQSILQRSAVGSGAVTAEAVTQAANQGDKLALVVLTRAGERIGQVLASVVSILAPEKIIISGGVSLAGDLILEPIRRIIKSESAELLTRGLAIEISQLQNRAGTLGAARMALINYFKGEDAWLNSSH